MNPDPVGSGVLAAGTNPWAVDWAACLEMGLDPSRIRVLQRPLDDRERFAWLLPDAPPEVVAAGDRRPKWRPFRPHFAWPSLRQDARGQPAEAGTR